LNDPSNWEFAAAVAAIGIGLGGLLLFSLIASLSVWRMFQESQRAADEAEKASRTVEELARQIAALATAPRAVEAASTRDMQDLRHQTDALREQQARLNEELRHLMESGAHGDNRAQQLRELEVVVERLEANLSRIAAAVANMSQREETR
jgi:hypothetical protein